MCVKFNGTFLRTGWLQKNFNYFAKGRPLDLPGIFNILKIRVLFFVFEKNCQRNFEKNCQTNLKSSLFLNCLKQYEIISKKTVVYGCLQYGIKQKSVTFVVHDVEM